MCFPVCGYSLSSLVRMKNISGTKAFRKTFKDVVKWVFCLRGSQSFSGDPGVWFFSGGREEHSLWEEQSRTLTWSDVEQKCPTTRTGGQNTGEEAGNLARAAGMEGPTGGRPWGGFGSLCDWGTRGHLQMPGA